MNNYVVTGFDEKYWKDYGSCWIYTLREVANYGGEVVVFGNNLSDFTVGKLKEKKVLVLENKEKSNKDIRLETIKLIADFAKTKKGNIAYWDADCFFENKIDEIFHFIENKFLVSENKNCGFLAAPYYQWPFLIDINNFIVKNKKTENSEIIYEQLTKNFTKLTKTVNNSWNYTDLKVLNNEKQNVMHPTGKLKQILKNKGFLFNERKNEKYSKFLEKEKGTRRLLQKKT